MKLQTLLGSGRWAKPKQLALAPAAGEPHELRMTGRGAYYSYSFDLGPNLDVFALADRLLTSDLATVAASPVTTDLRVGRRVIAAEKAYESAESFAKFLKEMYSDSPRWKELIRISKGLSVSIGYVVLKSAIRSLICRAEVGEPSGDYQIEETQQVVREAEEKLRETLMSYHVDGAIRVRIEQKEHYPRYFKGEPYIRLEMIPVLFSDTIAGESTIQISLMLHKSGICILTFSTDAGKDMTSSQMSSLLSSSARLLKHAEISGAVMSAYVSPPGPFTRIKRKLVAENSNDNWVTVTEEVAADADEKLTVSTVFEAYLQALENIAGRELQSEWHCYTTLSLGSPSCGCSVEQCKDAHRADFARLAMRARSSASLTARAEDDLLENHLQSSDKELWIGPGSAIYVAWSATSPDITEDLHQVIPLESAMLQVRQLEQIDSITSAAVVRDKNLFKAQNLLAVGLQEYQRNLLVGRDSAAIIDALVTKQGAGHLYDRLMDRVKVLESMVSTRYSRTQSRRSIAISISGFLAVLIFLLPRITESIDTFANQGEWPVAAAARLDEIAGGRGALVLWLYLIAIVAFVATFVAVSLRPRFRPVRARRFGYSTKRDIEVSLVDSEEVT